MKSYKEEENNNNFNKRYKGSKNFSQSLKQKKLKKEQNQKSEDSWRMQRVMMTKKKKMK